MNEKTHSRQNMLKLLLMVFLVMGAIAAVVWANLWKDDLQVATVRVDGNRIVTEKEILSLAGIRNDEKIFEVDLFAAQGRIVQNKFIKSVTVKRDVPGGITISVMERTPLAAVVLDNILYLDSEGVVLPPTRSENIFDLPVLTGTFSRTEMVPGKQIVNPCVEEALTVLKTAQELDDEVFRRISEVHVDGDRDIILYTAELGIPVIFGHGDAGPKLVKFDGFWREFVSHHGAQELQYIDLRFEDQVVVRWNHEVPAVVKSSMRLNILKKEQTWTTSL